MKFHVSIALKQKTVTQALINKVNKAFGSRGKIHTSDKRIFVTFTVNNGDHVSIHDKVKAQLQIAKVKYYYVSIRPDLADFSIINQEK